MSVRTTTYLSLVAQGLTGVLGLRGLLKSVPDENVILKRLLLIETIVNAVEFGFYSWFVRHEPENMAIFRYFDWVITTPCMLLSTTAYMIYSERKERGESTVMSIREHVREHGPVLAWLYLSNFLMLLFGFLGETGRMERSRACLISFAFFFATFRTLYDRFARRSAVGRRLGMIMTSIWAVYGIAFLFPDVQKNVAFNGLDIFSKNFFAVYLWSEIEKL
jgi:bacteriorhodopsin